jgi:hypothetical protein
MKREVAKYLMRRYPSMVEKMEKLESEFSNDVEAYIVFAMLKNRYEERIRKSGGFVSDIDSDKFIHELNVLADTFHVATDYGNSVTKQSSDKFFKFLVKSIPIEEKFNKGEITWEERTEMIAKLWNTIFSRKRKIKKKAI